MNTKPYIKLIPSIISFGALSMALVISTIIFQDVFANTDTQSNSQAIDLPMQLAPDDIISADEWNKIRSSLISLDQRTGEINLSNDGQMGVGLHGENPEADVHIKGSTYANADILLEDGETPSNKWNIGGGEIFAISTSIDDELIDGLSITTPDRFVGIRNHDPKVALHLLKGDEHEGVDYIQNPKKTMIIENIYDDSTVTNLDTKENNILSFLTASKKSSAGVQFETSENDGWHGWLGFFHEMDHQKLYDFDEDSEEKFIFLSSYGDNDLERLRANSFFINANGNGGMGIEKPFHKLHVYDDPTKRPSTFQTLDDKRFENPTAAVIEASDGNSNIGLAVNTNSSTSKIQFSDADLNDGNGNEKWDGIVEYIHAGDDLALSTSSQPYKAVLKESGYFGIGTKRNVGFKFHAKCPKEIGYDCGEIIGMFENPKPGGSPSSGGGGAYVAASSADAVADNSGAGFLAQKAMGTKGSLIHFHKKDVFVLEKTGAGYMAINAKGFFGIQIGKSDPDKIKHQLHIQECDTTGMSEEAIANSCNESEQNVMAAIENNVGSKAYFGAGASEKVGIKFVPEKLEGEWKGLLEYDNTKNKMSFGTNSENHRMDIDEKGWVGINKEDPEHGVHFVPKDGIMKVEGKLGVNKEPEFDVDAPSVNGDQLCVGGDCISSWIELSKYFALKEHTHSGYADSGHSH